MIALELTELELAPLASKASTISIELTRILIYTDYQWNCVYKPCSDEQKYHKLYTLHNYVITEW